MTANGLPITSPMRYVLQQWSVDCSPDHSLDCRQYRLWLKDPLVLYGVTNAVLAPGYLGPQK